MIEELVYFLTGDTGNETNSPVYGAVNTTAIRAVLESTRPTKIYRGQAQTLSTPYVLFYDNGERMPVDRGLGGNNNLSYSETHVMLVECGTIGDTEIQAKRRAGYLRLAVEGQLLVNKQFGRGALSRVDLGGTASTDTIADWVIDLRNPEPRTSGPGIGSVTTNYWSAKSIIRVLVTVNKRRSST